MPAGKVVELEPKMCGIAGILAYRNVAPAVDRAELARMNDRMAARGSDGSGIWIAGDRRIGFAHSAELAGSEYRNEAQLMVQRQ